MRRDDGAVVSYGAGAHLAPGAAADAAFYSQLAHKRAMVARFFRDLRGVLKLSTPQAALTLKTYTPVIDALENGHVELLPPWPEASRIITQYTTLARIDGRPVLTIVADLLRDVARIQPVQQARGVQKTAATSPAPTTGRGTSLARAGNALATGARRLPQGAIRQMRTRPDRAFYALSLPLGVLIVALNASSLDVVAKPFKGAVSWVGASMHEIFPTFRDGFRWIEVTDPRSRRGDKLRQAGR